MSYNRTIQRLPFKGVAVYIDSFVAHGSLRCSGTFHIVYSIFEIDVSVLHTTTVYFKRLADRLSQSLFLFLRTWSE